MATYVDALGAAHAWVNSRIGTLVGPTHALTKGAMLTRLDGTPPCYAYLTVPAAGQAMGAEDPDMNATVRFQVFAPTRESAWRGAIALAQEMITELSGVPVYVTLATGQTVMILAATNVTGPSEVTEFGVPLCVVDADFLMRP